MQSSEANRVSFDELERVMETVHTNSKNIQALLQNAHINILKTQLQEKNNQLLMMSLFAGVVVGILVLKK